MFHDQFRIASRWMTMPLFFCSVALISIGGPGTPVAAQGAPVEVEPASTFSLTAAERAAGWEVLFDGTSTDAWRGYRNESFPAKGWIIEDGSLKVTAGGGGGDIITRDRYGDFELVLEWKVAPGANSGIMYRVNEAHSYPWQTGPEYQILDDAGYNVAPDHVHAAGSLYDMYPPAEGKITKPAGEWNTTRIRIQNDRLEHWLNGMKVVEVNTAHDAWRERIAQSKFRGYEGFGVLPMGHLALQDHGNDVWFRNIRVRHLDRAMPREIDLLQDDSLERMGVFLNDGASMEDVFTIEGGVLKCSGKPSGFLHTMDSYRDFVLKLEWRWDPETQVAGNSGVLLRVQGELRTWPQCIEAQLQAGNAGDLLALGGATMRGDPDRTRGIRTTKLHAAEREAGEWNEYEIHVLGDAITLFVNGEKVNHATGLAAVSGPIALQSEGTPIHFRRMRIAPIPFIPNHGPIVPIPAADDQ